MSKKFKISVDGIEHIVEVNDFEGDMPVSKAVEHIAEKKDIENKVIQEKEVKENINKGDNSVIAPLQGVLQDIKVNVGQSVKAGDVLVIIEAMKMENEIVAPRDAKIKTIYLQKGTKVNNGDVILDLE